MKKLISLTLILTMLLALFSSCNQNTEKPSNTSTGEQTETNTGLNTNTDTNISTNTNTSTNIDDKENPSQPDVDNSGTIETIQTKKYYRELSSNYKRTTVNGDDIRKDGRVFDDDIFEMEKQSQYKMVTSYEELKQFTLLNCDEIEVDLFDNNYVVAILHYFVGPSIDGYSSIGFYDSSFESGNEFSISLDTFYRYFEDSTEDETDVYRLHFIIVPKNEIDEATEGVNSISVNENRLEQYEMEAFAIDTATEETQVYYVNDENVKDDLEILNVVSTFWTSFPCIAIHLSEPIKTDYIVNGFKYENEEIYISIQIFEKAEMTYLHEISANLIIVEFSRYNEDLGINVDNIPPNCGVNIMFENVSAFS